MEKNLWSYFILASWLDKNLLINNSFNEKNYWIYQDLRDSVCLCSVPCMLQSNSNVCWNLISDKEKQTCDDRPVSFLFVKLTGVGTRTTNGSFIFWPGFPRRWPWIVSKQKKFFISVTESISIAFLSCGNPSVFSLFDFIQKYYVITFINHKNAS